MSVSTPLEKHKRYGFFYKPNDLFWGLGIERESYLEFSDLLLIDGKFIKENHRPERYSVDYYKSYKSEPLKRTLSVFDDTDQIHLPVLINSHTLTKLDKSLEHQTTFRKKLVANSKFQGKCLFDILKESDPYFQVGHEKWFTFDGDSIELITQDFYKTTAEKVYTELLKYKSAFEQKIIHIFKEHLILSEYGTVKWATANHGFAVMSSNLKNLAMFNNGTYHINLTSRFIYYKPLCYQLFGDTENSKQSKFQNKYLSFASDLFMYFNYNIIFRVLGIDKNPEPGYSILYFYSKFIFYIGLLFLIYLPFLIAYGIRNFYMILCVPVESIHL